MAQSIINSSDNLPTSLPKINDNFTELYNSISGGLVRGSGLLRGNTTPHGSPTPASGSVNFYTDNPTNGTITIYVDGVPFTFTFSTSDPANGSTWIDTTTLYSQADYTSAFGTVLPYDTAITNIVTTSYTISFDTTTTGSSVTLIVETTMSGVTVSGTTTGTEGTPGSGAITEVELIPAVIGKTLFPIRIFSSVGNTSGPMMYVDVCLKYSGVYYPLCTEFLGTTTYVEILGGSATGNMGSYMLQWLNGKADASLIARLKGEVQDGGDLTVVAICERVTT